MHYASMHILQASKVLPRLSLLDGGKEPYAGAGALASWLGITFPLRAPSSAGRTEEGEPSNEKVESEGLNQLSYVELGRPLTNHNTLLRLPK